MNTKNPNPKRPLYRVSFSRITGLDDQGRDVLARPKEIGAVWPRAGGIKRGGILSFDLVRVINDQDA